ncbi:hypothetical protein [Amycolatopsis cihanbeyliensis]|uniref:Uncharacterized protein n=1 Tax=Amycolatopsis cihanbeyliensis TaxID=1128664 RepID=A0A542DER5_AMYCI|nr:hypothetical protein [Amycolatopsis cihanbeyliensis]TQJ01575.1 hypothetical protein FB471_1266 [Amycolatopsis cihanbeyliensis]
MSNNAECAEVAAVLGRRLRRDHNSVPVASIRMFGHRGRAVSIDDIEPGTLNGN